MSDNESACDLLYSAISSKQIQSLDEETIESVFIRGNHHDYQFRKLNMTNEIFLLLGIPMSFKDVTNDIADADPRSKNQPPTTSASDGILRANFLTSTAAQPKKVKKSAHQ